MTTQEDRFFTLSAHRNCGQSFTDLQDNVVDGSLPRQSGKDCTQLISGLIGLAGDLSWLTFTEICGKLINS